MGGVFLRRAAYGKLVLAGILTGAINGLFGTGGGMILVPLLALLTPLKDRDIFSNSIAIIFPICILSLLGTEGASELRWNEVFPYLSGSIIGGILSGLFGKRIPVIWLHRGLGIFILWGGLRYLC